MSFFKQFVAHIACMDKNGVIGDSTTNSIPWHHKEDFRYFKELTTNCAVVMGSRTWESLPKKPLPNRLNIVISNQKDFIKTTEELRLFNNINRAIWLGKSKKVLTSVDGNADTPLSGNIFIIGGSVLYNTTIDLVDMVYLTVLYHESQGDVFYPCFDKLEHDFVLCGAQRFEDNSGEKRVYIRKLPS